jgi:hypothetical protein
MTNSRNSRHHCGQAAQPLASVETAVRKSGGKLSLKDNEDSWSLRFSLLTLAS